MTFTVASAVFLCGTEVLGKCVRCRLNISTGLNPCVLDQERRGRIRRLSYILHFVSFLHLLLITHRFILAY